jgi:hypothetical protein
VGVWPRSLKVGASDDARGAATLTPKGDKKARRKEGGRKMRAKVLIMLASSMFWSPTARLFQGIIERSARFFLDNPNVFLEKLGAFLLRGRIARRLP